MSALELGRLFSLMEGVDPEGLFTAALRMSAGDALPQLAGLPPQLAGLEGLAASQMDDGNIKSVADPSGDLQEGGGSTDEDSRGSVGGTGGGGSGHIIPPRTGSINDRKCTKVLPASSSAPKYKFVVPNEYVYKFMQHLVERNFHLRDQAGKLWDCVLIQRKNKEKYEYMIQGWRRFGETAGVQEGDTVTIEMVDESIMQVTLERGAAGGGGSQPAVASVKKRPRERAAGMGSMGGSALAQQPQQHFADRQQQLLREAAQLQAAEVEAGLSAKQHETDLLQAQAQMLLAQRAQQQQHQPPMGMQQAQAQFGGMEQGAAPSGLLALIQQQQQQAQQAQQQQAQAQHQQAQHQQQAAQQQQGGGGPRATPQPVITPRSLTQHIANGLTGPLGPLGAAGINEAQLADLTAVISHLEKRQRMDEAPPDACGGGAPNSGGTSGGGQGGGPGGVKGTGPGIRLLSDVADLDTLMQENMGLREELRMTQAKIATLETGVLNIKSVLTRNTDPGLIAMTGVINLLNQMESPDFLPELGTIGRMTLTGLCSEVRRHLNGVLRMVWILRSLPDDVQQHNISGGGGVGSAGGGGGQGA